MFVSPWKTLLLVFMVGHNAGRENQDGAEGEEIHGEGQATPTFEWDPSGYVIYCPCMGRFGNQAEQFLGALAFSKSLNRTLILPPWRTYINVPFTDFFQLAPLQKYHKVITAENFMAHLAPKFWPQGSRRGYCWVLKETNQCVMKNGNPFQGFWDGLNIDFDEFVKYNLPYDVENPRTVALWNSRFPADAHPVLAFRGPPARFPVAEHDRSLQQYLKWSVEINTKALSYIKSSLPDGPFVGLHLRNGPDWVNACSHVEGSMSFMASPQCLGYSSRKKLKKEICFPHKEEIIQRATRTVRETGAKSVFVATDHDPMTEDLQQSLQPLGVHVAHLNPHLPQLDLAILSKADYFIGNCISTFSAFVKRHRDVVGKPSSFWACNESLIIKDEL